MCYSNNAQDVYKFTGYSDEKVNFKEMVILITHIHNAHMLDGRDFFREKENHMAFYHPGPTAGGRGQ